MALKDLPLHPKELDVLKSLHAVATAAQREFNIAFTVSCYAKGEVNAQFVGFGDGALTVAVPDDGD